MWGWLGSRRRGLVVLGWAVRGSFRDVLGAVLKEVGADRKARGVKDGVVLLFCGYSGVERAHNLSGGDSWRRGSRGAFDELVGGWC